MHNDSVSPKILESLSRVEVLYTDGMDARVIVQGRVREAADMSVGKLLRVVDEVEGIASGKANL